MFAVAKRVGLFLLLNILVMTTLSMVARVLGVDRFAYQHGLDMPRLVGFGLVWGMGGALISLAMSRAMARWQMNVRVIDPSGAAGAGGPHERFLLRTVERLARQAGLPATPQVGIYDSPDVNAFATGPTRGTALVAVSTGLLAAMNEEEATGVLAHEISHVANGDMVTMTLLQGVVNAFAIVLSRAVAFGLAQASRREDGSSRMGGGATFAVQFLMEILLMVLGSMLVAWFSRHREFRADAGGAALAGRGAMQRALSRLQLNLGAAAEAPPASAAIQSLQIGSRPRGGLLALFATHPPLEERIARLERAGSPLLS